MPCRQNVQIDDHCHEPQSEHGEKSHPPPRQIGAIIVWIVWIIGHWVTLRSYNHNRAQGTGAAETAACRREAKAKGCRRSGLMHTVKLRNCPHGGVQYHELMPTFLYRCPVSGHRVQGFVDDDPIEKTGHVYQPVTTACSRFHLFNPTTGKLLSEEKG
jgi:hypothetical protein